MTVKTLGSDNSQEINQKKQANANILHGSWSTMYTWNIETSWIFAPHLFEDGLQPAWIKWNLSPPPFLAKWQVKTPAKPSRRKYISLPISPRQMMKSAGKRLDPQFKPASAALPIKKKLNEITNYPYLPSKQSVDGGHSNTRPAPNPFDGRKYSLTPLSQGSERRPIKNLRARASKVCRNGTCITRPRGNEPGRSACLSGKLSFPGCKLSFKQMYTCRWLQLGSESTRPRREKSSDWLFFCLKTFKTGCIKRVLSLSWQGASFTSSCNCDVRSSKQFLARRSFCMSQTSEFSLEFRVVSTEIPSGRIPRDPSRIGLASLHAPQWKQDLEDVQNVWWHDGMSALQWPSVSPTL